MSRIGTTDFLIEVARGNVAGASTRGVVTKNESVGTSFEDLWGGTASEMIYPTASETWEIVSSSANDSAAGTGARTVLVNSLDINFVPQSQTVTMNGTTPVVLTGTHYRPDQIIALTAGSLGVNDGDITLRVSGGGNERNVMRVGAGASEDGHITVPAGQTYHILQVITILQKDFDGLVRTQIRDNNVPASPWVELGTLPYYQSAFLRSHRFVTLWLV